MPTYAYACKNCGYEFDIRQSFEDEALTVCPNCSQPTLRKKFGAVGIAFKGSGFYSTDKGGSPSKTVSSPGESGGSTSGEGAKESSSAASSAGSSAGSSSGSASGSTSGGPSGPSRSGSSPQG